MRIDLPWPDKRLNPNARIHWAQKARAVKTYRQTARLLALGAGAAKLNIKGKARVSVTFHSPDKRRRDLDNCVAMQKAYADGIADAIKVDDADWIVSYQFAEPRKGGAVIVEIEHE